ncbi:MAG: hypothetical protein CVU52_03725 [Deltaproteobacteria bacterium HGW-Deltaproteobacteria-10]|nr:MAG: hypothetical protein CVU52_03725 [Deltaproteobacteria bacterium HGW-Deltaproteobacteria-10]
MEDVVVNFIAALRNAGVRISISESLDAVRAALLVGFSERQAIKDSLAATLAKSVGEKEKFDACFDRYFSCDFFNASENAPRRIDPEIRSMIDSDIASLAIYSDAAGIAALIRDAAQASDLSSIRYSTQRNIYSARMLEIMGMPQLDNTFGRLKSMQDSGAAQAAAVQLAEGKIRILEAVRNYVEREYQLYAKSSDDLMESYLRTTRLTNIEQYYFGKMHEIIQKLVKQLEDRYSRRVKAAKRGKLDYKKTMRKGVCYGGFMFEPFWKKKKMDRPDVIAICDISRSVSRVVRFFLMFLYSMQKRIGRIRILAFCSNLADVTDIFEKYPIEEALSRMQDDPNIPIIRGRTDYDRTLTEFKEHYLSLVTKNTTVLILGDARNNYYNSRADILKMISERCKRLIWLNPETPSFWGTGDSEMKTYKPYCHVLKECNTLTHLERVVGSLVRGGARH